MASRNKGEGHAPVHEGYDAHIPITHESIGQNHNFFQTVRVLSFRTEGLHFAVLKAGCLLRFSLRCVTNRAEEAAKTAQNWPSHIKVGGRGSEVKQS